MRKKTKKSFLLAIGVAFCLAFAGTAFAIDNDSLESQTTEGLYDRTDPYDLATEPGLLYKLDRWRLYTNLSGYEDEDSFLIGTSGKLGAGSLAFFYETNKREDDWTDTEASYDLWEMEDLISFPNYDGTYESLEGYTDLYKNESITEENNFYAAYSIDFGDVSVGLSYAPGLRKSETSYSVGSDGAELDYHDTAHTTYDLDAYSSSNSRKHETDRTEHPFTVQAQIHTSDHWHLLAGIGYASMEQEDDLSEVYSYRELYENTNTGELNTYDSTTRTDGSVDEDGDGDEWSIYLEPVYEVNDMVSLRLDLNYAMLDGDFKGGRVETENSTRTRRISALADTRIWTSSKRWDGSSKGDFEETEWEIEPRVYLTFDKVRFALGVGYYYSEEEWDSTEKRNYSSTYTYDDGDGVATIADYTGVSSSTGYANYDGEEKTTRWRFPVATEFDLTDKLTLRAGAAYYRVRAESKETETEAEHQNETSIYTDGAGNVFVGPEQYYATAAADPVAYDADAEGATYTEKSDQTFDYTTYHLGLGYTFTENLKCDLMWSGSGGSVDTTELFASVTLTF